MSKVKHLRSKKVANGATKWEVVPPPYMKAAIKAHYEVFDDQNTATLYAKSIADQYSDYRRGIKRQIHIQEDTVGGLVMAYKKTLAWEKLSPNSKRTYDDILKGVLRMRIGGSSKMFQDMLARKITVEHAEKVYAQRFKDVSEHNANMSCKVLRRLWKVGDRIGKISHNPFVGMGLTATPERKILWTQEQVYKFVDTADEMGFASLGTMALLCYDLCQRPGDMRQLTWKNLDSEIFDFIQEKTKAEMTIPASPRLKKRLKNVSISKWHDHLFFYENTGKPYDRRLYNVVMNRIKTKANLPKHLQMRDLRRTGATEMAEAGCTNSELRSVTGHKSMEVLKIYVRPTMKLAQEAVNKRFASGDV